MKEVPLNPEKKAGERPAERGSSTGERPSAKPSVTNVPLDPQKK